MKLLFVYNADAGPINELRDALHKLLSPETYACELCTLTYGPVREKRAWKAFQRRSAHEMEFYHRNEFEAEYGVSFTYPVVLAEEDGQLEPVLTKEQMAQMTSVEELIGKLEGLEVGD